MIAAHRVVPELPVGDVTDAQAWYAAVLGATPVWTWQDSFGAVRLGDAELYVVRDRARGAVTCYLHVDDVDSVHGQVVAGLSGEPGTSGGTVVEPLEDREWSMREFVVRDPWGNSLRVGQPLVPLGRGAGFTAHDEEIPHTF